MSAIPPVHALQIKSGTVIQPASVAVKSRSIVIQNSTSLTRKPVNASESQPACKTNQVFSKEDCKCHCREPCQDCAKPQAWLSNSCNCRCPNVKKCDPLRYWDEQSCDCKCLSKQRKCCSNKIWDDKICDCRCKSKCKCAPNFEWDPYNCKCVCAKKLNCNYDSNKRYFDEGSCSCLCENAKSVRCEYGFDHTICKCKPKPCVENVKCAVGFIWDKNKCLCVHDTALGTPEYCMSFVN